MLKVTVPAPMAVMMAPEVIPVPSIRIPTLSPAVEETDVRVLDPLVLLAVKVEPVLIWASMFQAATPALVTEPLIYTPLTDVLEYAAPLPLPDNADPKTMNPLVETVTVV